MIANFIRAYNRVSIKHIAEELRINLAITQNIVVKLILDGKIKGYIDTDSNVLNIDINAAESNK